MTKFDIKALTAVAVIGALTAAAAGWPAAAAGKDGGWRVVERIAIRGRSVQLFSIDADGPDDAWAAGATTKDSGYGQRPRIEHWNGRQWRRVALPAAAAAHFGGDVPFGFIGASSSRDVWAFAAAGNTYLRLSGSHWTFGRLPRSRRGQVFVLGVHVFGPRDVWASGVRVIGGLVHGRYLPYAAWFNGRSWQVVAVPGRGTMASVSAVSARNMWALVIRNVTGTLRPDRQALLHWNGRVWQPAAHQPQLPARGYLSAVLAEPGGSVWVGGSAPNSEHGRSELVERWNDRAWTDISPPARPTRRDYEVTGLAGAGRGAIWVAGTTLPLSGRFWHYAHGSWSAPVQARWYPLWLAAVPGTTSVWAAGAAANLNVAVIAVAGPLPR